jgi:DNA-binding NarL/FixJ family response regulator
MRRRLVFIDDDKTELTDFRKIMRGHYACAAIHWPKQRARLFNGLAPHIVVSDLYLPPVSGDAKPTAKDRQLAVGAAQRAADSFSRLHGQLKATAATPAKQTVRDDKKRLKETMRAIADARRVLDVQWGALGQSPDNGIALLSKVKTRWPGVPFIFYSRKITPEDVIRVLQAGASDAIRKGALSEKKILARLALAQDFNRRVNVNVTAFAIT